MKQTHLAFLAVLLLSGLTALADYYFKLASQRVNPVASAPFFLGFGINALTFVGWVFVLRHLKLSTVGVIYSVSMVVLLVAIGYFRFGERLGPQEIVGLVLGVLSLLLLGRFN